MSSMECGCAGSSDGIFGVISFETLQYPVSRPRLGIALQKNWAPILDLGS